MDNPGQLTVMVMLSIFSVLGTIGNALVLYIYSHKKEKSTAGIFIMSLAGTDLFTCLFVMPFTEAMVYLQYVIRYDVACKIYMFFITCNVPFAAFMMVAIAIDRFFCICHPFLHILTISRAKIIVVVLLGCASTFGVITSLSHGVYQYRPSSQTNRTNELQAVSLGLANRNNRSLPHFVSRNCSNVDMSMYDLHPTNETWMPSAKSEYSYTGVCMPNGVVTSIEFLAIYQRVYAGTYLLSFFVVFVLYGLIYRSIHQHRAKRSKRKRSSLYPLALDYTMVETHFSAVTHVNPHTGRDQNLTQADGQEDIEQKPVRRPKGRPKPMTIKEKTLLANIRTAAMLFVVTIVFLVAFLPAWLMGLTLIEYNEVIFYMYFVYHVANPIIYAFMNKSFRDDLGKVIKCQSMPVVR